MGPHPCGCGGATESASLLQQIIGLQWGRIHADAEGRNPYEAPSQNHSCFNGAASMRMRRGRLQAEGHVRTASFNGAASMRMRRVCSTTCRRCRFPRRFNGAASMRMRRVVRHFLNDSRPDVASMGPHPCGCGGDELAAYAVTLEGWASMGPHPCGCGGLVKIKTALAIDNASMGPHPCGCGGPSIRPQGQGEQVSFNGAASMRMRRDRSSLWQ